MRRVILPLLLLSACGPDPGEFTRAQLSQAIQTNPARIDIGKYVTSDWERLCIFRGRTSLEVISSVLGFAWPQALDTGIETSDKHALLVFVKGTDVQQWVMFEKARGDFTLSFPARCLSRDSAVFKVENPNVTAYRKLVQTFPMPDMGPATAADLLGILQSVHHHVKVYSNARRIMIDPATHRARELAAATGNPIGGESDAYVCGDATDSKSCVFQNADLVLKIDTPEGLGPVYTVTGYIVWPVREQPWRTQRHAFQLTARKSDGYWRAEGNPVPQVRSY